ncbi:uncharacterized protein ANIA_04289 [Aspergillus nidulans FGSC A4]|uniref:Integrase catalytic domain-containing protein n=1 Tax=Emericella nidulans (strain FGSC A4 / ATCC 38163 / CBS 112.46 / NRRL 194 / M139) TaxID=227321 RepID=C8V3R7_EMENI|nr:hypothetical protein [Aspergillus nidulans FGSC A4]CBF74296.1 TPA: conserved hypothetical protein [Aspergillus nidulans FGSC A4]
MLDRHSAAKVSVILRTRDDWQSWIEDIKSVALLSKVWGYVDPSKQEDELEEIPIEPEIPADDATSAEIKIFEIKYNQYQRIDRGIAAISEAIHNSLSAPLKHFYINNRESPYKVLRALKKQFAPKDQELQMMAIRRYQKARSMPIKQSNPEAWLTEFESAYYGMKQHDLPEAQDMYVIRDFLGAVMKASKEWAMIRRNLLHQSEYKSQTIADTIAAYREYLSDEMLYQDTKLDVAFAASPTLQGAGISNQTNRTNRVPYYMCGQKHFFRECPYVVISIRKPDFMEEPEIRKKFDDILKIPGAKCNMLKKAMELNKQTTVQNKETTVQHAMAAIMVGFSASEYSMLKESFILDSGATVHICNDKTRFKKLKQEPAGYLRAGNAVVPIEGTGVGDISPNCRGTSNVMISLQETAYVPGFHTNIISASRMKRAGFIWDFAEDRVVKNGHEVCRLAEYQGLWVVEQNGGNRAYAPANENAHAVRPKTSIKHSSKPLILAGNTDIWHKQFGHLNHEAIRHLPNAVKGIQIDDVEPPRSCETCKYSSAPRQISRRPANRATQAFERVHFDLIEFNKAWNGDRWCTHFYDEFTHMHFVYTHGKKNGCVDAAIHLVALIECQFGTKMKFYKSDNEQTLGGAFRTFTDLEGIIHEVSVVATPEQNGFAERSGGVLTSRARHMMIKARLPLDMWPVSMKAAAYILNRTLIRMLGWITPFEKATGKRPNMASLYTFGCRAYVRDQSLNQQNKTLKSKPRRLGGYLVGYKASNIWLIWIPSKQRIEAARDVIFDESSLYDPEQPNDDWEPLATDIDEIDDVQPNTDGETTYEGVDDCQNKVVSRDLNAVSDSPENAGREIVQSEAGNGSTSPPPGQLPTPESTSTAMPGSWDFNPAASSAEPPDRETVTEPPDRADSPSHWLLESLEEATEAAVEADVDRDVTPTPTSRSGGGILDNQSSSRPIRRRNREGLDQSLIIEGKRERRRNRDPNYEYGSFLPLPPRSWNELLKHPLKQDFILAAGKEYTGLKQKETFKVVDINEAANHEILPVIWIFTYKFDENGNYLKAKARICVRGDLQARSAEENRAGTASARAFRSLMALVAAFDLDTDQKDAINAFLNAWLDQVIYARMPEGFKQPGKVWKVLKALYGLRKSPKLWQEELSAMLQEYGLEAVPEEECLFTSINLLVLFYVDDIIIINRPTPEARTEANRFKEALEARYELRHMGEVGWFLNIRVIRDRPNRKLWLCQDAYMDQMAAKFHLNDMTRWPETPLQPNMKLLHNEEQATPGQIHEYQQKTGSALFPTIITRPDAALAVNELARFSRNPSPSHMEAINQVIAYLYHTRYLALEFSASEYADEIFICTSDASFANNEDRKSTGGYLCKLFGAPIEWKSGKQRAVTTSTTEAEYVALAEAAKATYWWRRVFKSLEFDPGHTFARNEASYAMLISTDHGSGRRSRKGDFISNGSLPIR